MRLPEIHLSPRGKRVAKWVGYPLLALFSFLFALQQALPTTAIKRRISDLLAPKYEVLSMNVDHGFMPGTIILSKVGLRSRPTKPDDKVSTIFIDKITAHFGILSFLSSFGSKSSIDLDIKLGGGDVSGNLGLSSTRTQATLDIAKVSAETVPGIADFVGLPMGGRIGGSATIDLPAGDWRQAEAVIKLDCTSNCTIGDGVAKIYPKPRPGQPQLDGVTVAKLFLNEWHAEFVVAKGHADLKKLDVKSDDGELYVDFHVQIQRSLMDSTVTQGCIKFKGSETLRKRDEKFYNALTLTGAPLGPDGYHYIKLAGTLGNIRRLPILCDLSGGGSSGGTEAMPSVEGHISRPPSIPTEGAAPRPPTYVPPQTVPQVQAPTPSPSAPPPVEPETGAQPPAPSAIQREPLRPVEGAPNPSAPPPDGTGNPAGAGSAAGMGPGTAAGSGTVDQQAPQGGSGSGSGSPMN